MPPRKEKENFAKVARKDYWHPYGLSELPVGCEGDENGGKFAKVVTMILKGRFSLLPNANYNNKK